MNRTGTARGAGDTSVRTRAGDPWARRARPPGRGRTQASRATGRGAALASARAALAAGVSPGRALQEAAAEQPALATVASATRLGTPVAELAADVDTGDAALDLLVRALGVAEAAGAGGVEAVEQALVAARDEADLQLLLRARTAQARGTARLLAWLPAAAWALLALADPRALGYVATALGALTSGLAVLLAFAAQLVLRRIVRRAEAAAAGADPLHPPRPPWRWMRGAALGLPAAVLLGLFAGPGLAAAGLAALLLLAARPGRPPAPSTGSALRTVPEAGGSTETVELVAVALRAGLSPATAIAVVAPLAPPLARPPLQVALRRLQGGWPPGEALRGGGLDDLAAVLDACTRWGSPTAPALSQLAADLRAERRAVAEEAAERTQLQLVFPTTLLTLPAFLLGVVPPLLWGAFRGVPGPMPLP